MSSNVRGALFALVAFGLYSTHDVIVKLMGASYSPIQLIFFSVLFSFPIALLILMRDTEPGTLLPVHPWWITFRTLAAVLTGISAFYAFTVLPLAQVYAIIFATPLMITILSIPILKERVRLRRWLAVLVGLAGVVVVIQPGTTVLTLGHFAALAAALGSAFASVVLRKIGPDERPVVIMLYPMMANFVLMGSALYFVYEPPGAGDMGLFAAMAVLGSAGGLVIIAAYKAGEAVVVAPMQYSQIVWAAVFGFLFFDEGLDRNTLIGTAIIIASGLYILLRESRTDASENKPVLRTKLRPDTGTTLRRPGLMGVSGKSGLGPKRGEKSLQRRGGFATPRATVGV